MFQDRGSFRQMTHRQKCHLITLSKVHFIKNMTESKRNQTFYQTPKIEDPPRFSHNPQYPLKTVARILCDRQKCDPTFLSIDVCPHRRQCNRHQCGRNVCPNDVKVDISATSLRSTLVQHLLKLTLVRHSVLMFF